MPLSTFLPAVNCLKYMETYTFFPVSAFTLGSVIAQVPPSFSTYQPDASDVPASATTACSAN